MSDVVSMLERIERRLETLEQKLEQQAQQRHALDFRDAARLMSLSLRSVARLAKSGELRTVRLGGRVLVPMSEVVRLSTPKASSKGGPLVRPSLSPANGKAEASALRAVLRRRD